MLSCDSTSSPTYASVRSHGPGTIDGAPLVAVGAADRVAVMAVGDQDRVRRHGSGDGGDPARVVDPLDDVLVAGLVDAAARPASPGSRSSSVRPAVSDSPHTGDRLACGGSRQVEPIGLGLRRGALVRQHAAGALVDHLERADDADGLRVRAVLADGSASGTA